MSYFGSGYFGTYFGGIGSSGGSGGSGAAAGAGIVRITLTNRLVNNKVAESSAFTQTIRFWNDDEDQWIAEVPATARYRIDNPDNDTQIVGWTTITPAATVQILVTASQNAIVSNASAQERRQMTVETNQGADIQYQETKDWWIVNLAGQT
jgi:hypothetical protein